MRKKTKWLFGVVFLIPLLTTAQIEEWSISNENRSGNFNLRQSEAPLSLPFWDDFSYDQQVVDDSLWDNSNDVLVNRHYGYIPPTLGVATFDGIDAFGEPYNTDPESSERTDRLISHAIDLSAYTSADDIYLSFFYQIGGYGEIPDISDDDRLQLEFKDADGNWNLVLTVLPNQELDPLNFYQALFQVQGSEYFHADFQFAIQAFGNQSGPYDIWNIDYIYMNSGRSNADRFYPDRAVNLELSNIFTDYSSIPREHLNPEENIINPYYRLNNLNDVFQTYRQQVDISIQTTTGVYENSYPLTAEGTNSPIFENELDTITVPYDVNTIIADPSDSIESISYKIGIKTFDNRIDSGNYELKYEPIDFRVNDTLERTFEIRDYYAYDDGTAEAAGGLQIAGNRLAYRFHLLNADSSFIHGIDMNTVYAGQSANGKSVEFQVWAHNDSVPGKLLYSESKVINGSDLRDSLTRYTFKRPVHVSDTFYVGFNLVSSGRFPIGLDKNTDNADKIFENVSGAWASIGDRLFGTFMIRPFIGPEPTDPVTSLDPSIQGDKPTLYPNPSKNGVFYVTARLSDVEVYTITGALADYTIENEHGQSKISIQGKGLFIIKAVNEERVFARKVIVSD